MPALEELLAGTQCPRCGRIHTYVPRRVDFTAPVGDGSTVTVAITVGECTYCHERVLDQVATDQVAYAIAQARAGSPAVERVGTAYRLK
jgi:YgiT-type zinc finger domain-containing protein